VNIYKQSNKIINDWYEAVISMASCTGGGPRLKFIVCLRLSWERTTNIISFRVAGKFIRENTCTFRHQHRSLRLRLGSEGLIK